MSWSVSRDRGLDLAGLAARRDRDGAASSSSRLRRRLSGVRRSCATESVTSRTPLHQPLDAVEHAVEVFGQRVELVMRAG